MSFALLRYTGNNSTVTYSVSFAYRSTDDVIVSLDGVVKTITTHYTFPTSGQITFGTAPGTGVIVEIKRATSQSTRIVDYQAGAVIKETDLDNDSIQGFYMAQEAIDITEDALNKDSQDRYDATSKRIINVTDPTGAQDASTKNYVDVKFAADVALTAADVISTAADVVTTTQDAIDTAADVVLTNADVVLTNADVVLTNADVVTVTNIYDDFDDRYLGAKTSAPTLDNDGAALADGSMYFNTTTPDMWVYDLTNTIWVTVSNSTASTATAADVISTAADVVLTNADVVLTNADVVLTNADELLTRADTVLTAADVVSTAADVVTVAGYLDTFDDDYLGAKATNPSVDNDGDALADGALYFDTTNNIMKVYDLGTTAWLQLTPTAGEQTNIDTVSGISANVTTVAGISANVTTVAGISSDVTTVAADGTDIGVVSGISGNVTTVAGISGNTTTVAGISGNVTTVAGVSANVTTVAGVASDVTTVAGVSSDVSAVAAFALGYTFSTTTTMADPGTGIIRLNHATLASVTAIAIDDLDNNSVDQSAYVISWDDSTNTNKGTLRLRQGVADATYTITALTDNVGWSQLAVTYVTGSGTFANATESFIGFSRSGDKGVNGTGIVDSVTGGTGITNSGTAADPVLNVDASQTGITSVGTIGTGTWQGTAINATYLDGQSGTNTGDEVAGSTTVAGVVERSTSAENVTGSSDTVYPTVLGAKEIVDTHGVQTSAINVWTLPQRTALVVDNDGSFNQSLANNFKSTPAGAYALTFTNHADGQSGYILLINSGGHAISLAATSKGSATVAATISTAGTYLISYLSDGTNSYITSSALYA